MRDACEIRKQRLTREAFGGCAAEPTGAQQSIGTLGGLLVTLLAVSAFWQPLSTTARLMAQADTPQKVAGR